MSTQKDNASPPAPPTVLLRGRDWTYVLGLLVPFTLYVLVLKMGWMASLPGDLGLLTALRFSQPDLLFALGYALFWIGLFAVAARGGARAVVVVLFHVTTVLVCLITAGASQFLAVTGSALDLDTVIFFLSSPGEVWPVVASEATPAVLAALSAALLYAVFGPWLITLLAHRQRSAERSSLVGSSTQELSWLGPAGTLLIACALVALSASTGGMSPQPLAGNAFVQLALTEIEHARNTGPYFDPDEVRADMPTDTTLQATPQTEKRNVVVISLESTRASSVTPYNPDANTTPFMDKLAGESLVAESAYAVVPHTTNALTASLCGIVPPDRRYTDSLGDSIPARCLPDQLREQGYATAFFQSATEDFERRPEVVENMGYEDFYSVEDMDKSGFEQANYFGLEDDVMLEPSKKWLQENGQQPFLVTYNTITPHHQYLAPSERYGRKDLAEDPVLDRYQNSVRYVDFFVKNIVEQYKDLGLYEDTVFVITGDHGEGFGEHGRFQHDNVIWNEGLRIPMMILDPQRTEGTRVDEPTNELDILPTVVDALGYKVVGGEYPGSSLLEPLPENRTLEASCWYEDKCLASIRGDEKYIYHFGQREEEVFDLAKDPLEKNNLADQVPPEQLEERRDDLLAWRARSNAAYGE